MKKSRASRAAELPARSASPAAEPGRSRILVIQNRQRTKPVRTALLRRLVGEVINGEWDVNACELCIHLVDAPEMARINGQFLQHAGSTDVITFDLGEEGHGSTGPLRGEIYVSIPDAVKQAREFRTTWQAELARYVIHGLLHLRGHDDRELAARRVMKREEGRLLRKIAGKHDLEQLEKPRQRM